MRSKKHDLVDYDFMIKVFHKGWYLINLQIARAIVVMKMYALSWYSWKCIEVVSSKPMDFNDLKVPQDMLFWIVVLFISLSIFISVIILHILKIFQEIWIRVNRFWIVALLLWHSLFLYSQAQLCYICMYYWFKHIEIVNNACHLLWSLILVKLIKKDSWKYKFRLPWVCGIDLSAIIICIKLKAWQDNLWQWIQWKRFSILLPTHVYYY